MNTVWKHSCGLILLFFALGCFVMGPSVVWGQQFTHRVEKGETLWSICEKYYGNTDLWPKLWQMNPFITNPHLLNPGDVVTLLEKEPIKKAKVPKVEEKTTGQETTEPVPETKGIDVSGLCNVRALGYLSLGKVKPWGRLFTADTTRLILSKGDTVFVHFTEQKEIKENNEFIIYKLSPPLRHPLTEKKLGYTLSICGKLIIKESIKKNFYRAEIDEAYRPVHIGDLVIPFEPISPCVQPISLDREFIGNIVAVKDQQEIIGKHAIVYLDRGFNHGIRRGNLFEVVTKRIVQDPDVKPETVYDYSKKITLPDMVLGTIMIIEARPDTATAVVLSSKEHFNNGASIKGLSWVETPESLSLLSACPID